VALQFTKATKTQARLRLALLGPAGSGKTYSALAIGRALVGEGGKIALMDTEHGSASKYADMWEFDTIAPDLFSVETYLEVIRAADRIGYDLLILDSLSHAWAGKGGLLEFVDNAAKRSQSGNTFGAWREATPKHNELIEAMLATRCHLIVTMRTKMEYVQERDERTGKTAIRKVGLQPIQRDGLEYEFDVVGDLSVENELIVSKTRCSALRGGVFPQPGENVAAILRPWLSSGAAPPPPKPVPPAAAAPSTDAESNGATAPVRSIAPPSNGQAAGFATQAQVRAIYSIGRDQRGMHEAEVDEKSRALFGVEPSGLTRKQASEFITGLQANRDENPPPLPTSDGSDDGLFRDVSEIDGVEVAVPQVRTRGELFGAILRDFGWQQSKALREVGYSRPEDIAVSHEDFYRQVAALARASQGRRG
jgi:hypothetical protein